MKKLGLFLSLVGATAFYSNSANALVRFGVEGGLSSAGVAVDPATTLVLNSRSGMALGGLLEFGIGSTWHICVEGLYAQKGYVAAATSLTAETTYKYDYFEVPVTLNYRFDLPIVKPFLFAGPFFSFKSKAQYQATGSTTSTDITTLKSTDMGLTFGGGVEFSFPVLSLFLSGRYDLGLSNVNDTPGSTTTVKTKAAVVMGGLLFGI